MKKAKANRSTLNQPLYDTNPIKEITELSHDPSSETDTSESLAEKRYLGNPYKPNILDSTGCFSALFFGWCQPLIGISRHLGYFEQKFHSQIPKRDNSELNTLKFEEHAKKSGIGASIKNIYFSTILKNGILTFIYQTLFCGLSLIMFFIIQQASDWEKYSEEEGMIRFGIWYAVMVLSQLVASFFQNYVACDTNRLSFRVKSGVSGLLHQKILKISALNGGNHTEGSIINYMQVDVQKLDECFAKYVQMVESATQIIVGYVMCAFIIGLPIVTVIVAFILCAMITICLYQKIFRYENIYLKAQDIRIQFVKSILKNIKSIKSQVWEDIFFLKVTEQRLNEASAMKKRIVVYCVVVLFNWLNPTSGLVGTIAVKLLLKQALRVAFMLGFVKIFSNILKGMAFLPLSIQYFVELNVSLKRLNKFLKSEEVDSSYVSKRLFDSDVAIRVRNGYFYWQQRNQEWVQKHQRKSLGRTTLRKKGRHQSIYQSKLSLPSQALDAPLDNQKIHLLLTSEERKIASFCLKDINIEIKKGQLVMVIGDIGSGKSSLFYSIFGEMSVYQHAKNLAEVEINGSVSYLGQKPWLQNQTIIQNVIQDIPFDKERFNHAVYYSALDEDLKTFEDGANRTIADGGDTLSGGQRTRLGLARMIYQDSDIYFLDDPLSALDNNVAAFLVEETICGKLKDKTRIVVTHSIQHLSHADHVILIDEGEIKQAGTYQELKDEGVLDYYFVEKEEEVVEEVAQSYIQDRRSYKAKGAQGAQGTDLSKEFSELVDRISQGPAKLESEQSVNSAQNKLRKLNTMQSDIGGGAINKDLNQSLINPAQESQNMQNKESYRKYRSEHDEAMMFQYGQSEQTNDPQVNVEKNQKSNYKKYNTQNSDDEIDTLKLTKQKEKDLENFLQENPDQEINEAKNPVEEWQRNSQNEQNEQKVLKKQNSHISQNSKKKQKRQFPTITANTDLNKGKTTIQQLPERQMTILKKLTSDDKSTGRITWNTFKIYVNHCGGPYLLSFVFLFTLAGSGIQLYSVRYLLVWAEAFDEKTKWDKFYMWTAFNYGFCFVSAIRFLCLLLAGITLSKKLHSKMLYRVLHSEVEDFLEKVSMGSILNRFTKDLNIIDKEVMHNISDMTFQFGFILFETIFLVYTLNWPVAIPLVIFVILSIYYQDLHMSAKREMIRLEAISRGPILSFTSDTIRGLTEIRIAKETASNMGYKMKTLLNENLINSIYKAGLECWFRIRVAVINILLVQVPSFIYIVFTEKNKPNVINLAQFIFLASIITEDIIRALLLWSQAEIGIISIERCYYLEQLQQEPKYQNFEKDEAKMVSIITNRQVAKKQQEIKKEQQERMKSKQVLFGQGRVEFQNVTAQYDTSQEPVLRDLSFEIKPKQKIGIVGRSGAGKSSLIKLFWLCLEPSRGRIMIDEKDICQQNLKMVRKEIEIVSQETSLFEGTLRENLNPFMDKNEEDDKKLIDILKKLGLRDQTFENEGLDMKVEMDGDNFSQGQKQVICFARALSEEKKVVILDEATASLDIKSERAIQEAVISEFANSTMFIVAHRIQTVLDCDKIMVMSFGELVEFGSPKELMEKENGYFKDIYEQLVSKLKN